MRRSGDLRHAATRDEEYGALDAKCLFNETISQDAFRFGLLSVAICKLGKHVLKCSERVTAFEAGDVT